MKKIIIIISIYMCIGASLKAQQENHYTMFMYNKMMYNPAFAGARDVGSVWALYRGQWIAYKGAPSSQLIGFDTPLGKTRASVGGSVSHHQIGIQRNINAALAYSYGLINTQTTSFKLGINGAFRNLSYDLANPDLYIRDGIANDPTLMTVNDQRNFNRGNVGAGLYFSHKSLYFGASVPNIYQSALSQSTSKQERHFYAFVGGLIPMGSRLDLKPALSVRYVKNTPVSIDANVGIMYNKKMTFGASYRTDSQIKAESASGILFYQATNRMGMGVSYDVTLSKLRSYNSGSIEAIIRYDFGGISRENVQSNFDNPRYFF